MTGKNFDSRSSVNSHPIMTIVTIQVMSVDQPTGNDICSSYNTYANIFILCKQVSVSLLLSSHKNRIFWRVYCFINNFIFIHCGFASDGLMLLLLCRLIIFIMAFIVCWMNEELNLIKGFLPMNLSMCNYNPRTGTEKMTHKFNRKYFLRLKLTVNVCLSVFSIVSDHES